MFETANYGPVTQEILESVDNGYRLPPLAPPGPLAGAGLKRLRTATVEELFDGEEVASQTYADCVRSALFLYFSALDESHTISQGIGSATGSFLHGIMHRQEPDYSNAKYWFRRTGAHELFPTLREDALRARLSSDALQGEIERRRDWDPLWFVDQCEAAVRRGDATLAADLENLQRLEWQLLFDYCYRKALAG